MLVLGKSSYFREPQVGELSYFGQNICMAFSEIFHTQWPNALEPSFIAHLVIRNFPKNEQPKCLKISRNPESGKACDLPCKNTIFQGLLILEEICDILKEVNQLVDLFVSRSVKKQLSERISSISNQRLSTYCKCLFLNPDKWCVFSPTNSCQGRFLHSFYIRCGWKLQMWLK